LEDTVFLMARGGWPSQHDDRQSGDALEATKSYFSSLFEFKTSDNKKFRNKKPDRGQDAFALLRSQYLYGSLGQHLDRRCDRKREADELSPFRLSTEYDAVLKDLFLVENLEAWNPQLRSKAIVRSAEVRHFRRHLDRDGRFGDYP
jgi:hypothetical protein